MRGLGLFILAYLAACVGTLCALPHGQQRRAPTAGIGVAALGLFLTWFLVGGLAPTLALPQASQSLVTRLGLPTALNVVTRGALLAGIVPALVFGALLTDKPQARLTALAPALGIILVSGLALLLTDTLLVVFLAFELLLLAALFLLQATSKSERILEAAAEMFFWTLLGSAALLLGFVTLAARGIWTFTDLQHAPTLGLGLSLLVILGFGVKVPLWPCYSWLLRAHVEASVEFSILLSGLIVKLGLAGLFRFIQAQPSAECAQLLLGLSIVAIVEAAIRLPAQRDLKRIVALTTVIEMNWACCCVAVGGATMDKLAALIMLAHSFSTTAEFYLTELLVKRFQTRDVCRISAIYVEAPLLWFMSLMTLLTTIGFPGSSLFLAKVAFLAALFTTSGLLFIFFLVTFMLLLPLFFFRLWVPLWFGARSRSLPVADLTSKEWALLALAVAGSLVLGLAPAVWLGPL